MKLAKAVDSYLTLKRSLGAVFSAEARILRSFARALGDILLDDINREATYGFCRGTGPPTRWWERKHYTLRDFFVYLVTRGHMSSSPLPELAPRIPRSFEPYIYSREELQRLLDSTEILADNRSPLQHTTFRTLLLVLYGAGLRPSEALRLRCCDVDLDDRVLAIWDTKFFKSRLVPIGTALTVALHTYRNARKDLPMPADARSAFFASRTGGAISLSRLEKVFVRLRKHAGIRSSPGARWQPRLHDMRHAFAVHRLVAWYREGADVQACLPLLSTYLGHANVSGTQAYLTMTPELLAEASKRFERYATLGDKEEHDV
ncbi:MAG: tyrosine-type recombinase/integrase [Syntrophobacteraceae bacterium]|jgi:site-specific recombinase XerD|nr:tyrosine-type recombinase/integrase [Syntrophobacteraceae bacterium]